jgi:hypothetical protein
VSQIKADQRRWERDPPKPVYPHFREGQEVLLLPAVGQLHSEHRVADLLDDDGPAAKARFLSVVAREFETFGLVLNDVGGDGRVV